MDNKKRNIAELLLEQLNVKFTKEYIYKLYNEEPYHDTLFGVSNILSEYNVKSTVFRINDIDDIKLIKPPFIVNFEGNITLVDSMTDENISCVRKNKRIDLPFDTFIEKWDRIILLAEADEKSQEPDYREHRIKYLFNIARKNTFIITSFLLFIIGFIINGIYNDAALISLSIISLIGTYMGYLLVQKQMYIQNNQADKICSMLKNGNCNSVLDSAAAKIMGVVGWSEIGLSYFISNILISVFFPDLISYLALVNICALPYSIWSVWYQKYRVKQWCPLCLVVQFLLWVIFIVNLFFDKITFPEFAVLDVLLTACVYIMPFLIISILLPTLNNKRYTKHLEREILNLRLNPEVFATMLKQQPYHHIDKDTSNIFWGNRDAKTLITIVTNPHCSPCAIMHKRVEKLLERTGRQIGVQYIFTSFSEELESSSNFLVSVYLSEEIDLEEKKEIYRKWFEEGRYDRKAFWEKYNLQTDYKKVKSEIDKHEQWEGMKMVYGTPTIFINGYQLPDQYQIDDLIYFLNLKILDKHHL